METERLEVRVPGLMLAALKREARQRAVPVSQLVREAIELLLDQDRQSRRQAAEALFAVHAPVADWKTMKREITTARTSATSDE